MAIPDVAPFNKFLGVKDDLANPSSFENRPGASSNVATEAVVACGPKLVRFSPAHESHTRQLIPARPISTFSLASREPYARFSGHTVK